MDDRVYLCDGLKVCAALYSSLCVWLSHCFLCVSSSPLLSSSFVLVDCRLCAANGGSHHFNGQLKGRRGQREHWGTTKKKKQTTKEEQHTHTTHSTRQQHTRRHNPTAPPIACPSSRPVSDHFLNVLWRTSEPVTPRVILMCKNWSQYRFKSQLHIGFSIFNISVLAAIFVTIFVFTSDTPHDTHTTARHRTE